LRVLNEIEHTILAETPGGHVEGVVRVRGFEASGAGRSFGYRRHEPEAVVIRGEDDLRRLPIDGKPSGLPLVALPIAVYLAARLLLRRRR